MNKLLIAALISLSTLLFACDGESSSNGGDGAGSVPSSAPSGGADVGGDSSDEIDARNEGIQQNLDTETPGSSTSTSTSTDTDIEPIAEPVELEPIENEDEDSLDSNLDSDN